MQVPLCRKRVQHEAELDGWKPPLSLLDAKGQKVSCIDEPRNEKLELLSFEMLVNCKLCERGFVYSELKDGQYSLTPRIDRRKKHIQ